MTESEIKRIDDSFGRSTPWAVYTVLPHEVAKTAVAGSADGSVSEGIGENLAETPQQSIPDTQPDPTKDKRPALAQTYATLIQRRIQLLNLVQMQEMQKAALKTTATEADQMIVFYTQEKEKSQAQHQEKQRQYAEVKKLYDATAAEVTNIETLISSLRSLNKKMLADLTQAQLHASEIILERNAALSMTQ